MADRDWLSELSEAIGEDTLPPPPSSTPADHEELQLEGPGRSLEGWADQLAAPIGYDPEPEAPPPPDPGPPPATEASDVAERLARVEALLSSDLDKLGPAVIAESVAAIEAQVAAVLARLASLDEPLARLEGRVSAYAATLLEPVRVEAVVPTEVGDALTQLSVRFAALEQIIEEATASIDDPAPVEVVVPAESLAPVAKVLGDRIDVIRDAIRDLAENVSDLQRTLHG